MAVYDFPRFWCSPCRNPGNCIEDDPHTHHLTWYGRLYFRWYPKLRVRYWLRGLAVVLTGFTVMACSPNKPPAPTPVPGPTGTSMTTVPLTTATDTPTVTQTPNPPHPGPTESPDTKTTPTSTSPFVNPPDSTGLGKG